MNIRGRIKQQPVVMGLPESLRSVVLAPAVTGGSLTIKGVFYKRDGTQYLPGNTVSPFSWTITTATSLQKLLYGDETVTFEEVDIHGFAGECSGCDFWIAHVGGTDGIDDVDANWVIDGIDPPAEGYPKREVNGGSVPVSFGLVPASVAIDGGGASSGDTGDTYDLELYALKGTATVTVVVDLEYGDGQRVTQASMSVGATAKSLRVFIEAIPTTWDAGWRRAVVRSISGGQVWWNRSGNRDTSTNNGVIAGQEPTTTGSNSDQLAVGDVLGEL